MQILTFLFTFYVTLVQCTFDWRWHVLELHCGLLGTELTPRWKRECNNHQGSSPGGALDRQKDRINRANKDKDEHDQCARDTSKQSSKLQKLEVAPMRRWVRKRRWWQTLCATSSSPGRTLQPSSHARHRTFHNFFLWLYNLTNRPKTFYVFLISSLYP